MPGKRLAAKSSHPSPARSGARRRTVPFFIAAGSVVVAASVGATAAALSGSPSNAGATRSAPGGIVARHTPSAAHTIPVRVPSSGAYLGIDPNANPPQTTQQQYQEVAADIHRPFGIISFYINWTDPPPISGMATVTATGSIPMLNMHCGVDDAQIIAGTWDAQLRQDAEALKALGTPVFFRWFWEMNLTNSGNHPTCLGASGNPALQQQNYIAAYIHIWNIFHNVGADNVSFVWAPSDAVSAPTNWTAYYPGSKCSQCVDWIGADLYARAGTPPFATAFNEHGFYTTFSTYGKPMILSETGACATVIKGSTCPADQAPWLSQIETSIPTTFPDLHAIVYVDATDSLGDYDLEPGTSGMAQFEQLGRNPYFSQLG